MSHRGLFCNAAQIAQLKQQTATSEEELKARANDILHLQKLLNTSRHEYSILENQLKVVQQNLAQQQVLNTI